MRNLLRWAQEIKLIPVSGPVSPKNYAWNVQNCDATSRIITASRPDEVIFFNQFT
jgi:hypothetical protein